MALSSTERIEDLTHHALPDKNTITSLVSLSRSIGPDMAASASIATLQTALRASSGFPSTGLRCRLRISFYIDRGKNLTVL